MKIKLLFTVIVVSFLTCCGCSSDKEYYTLIMYERKPIEVRIDDKEKLQDLDQYFSRIVKESKKISGENIDLPKSFSYVINKNDKIEYRLTSGYLIYNDNYYVIDDYDNKIKELKLLFHV